jgi:hypothetical protein
MMARTTLQQHFQTENMSFIIYPILHRTLSGILKPLRTFQYCDIPRNAALGQSILIVDRHPYCLSGCLSLNCGTLADIVTVDTSDAFFDGFPPFLSMTGKGKSLPIDVN